MQKTPQKPILIADLTYSIRKFVLVDGYDRKFDGEAGERVWIVPFTDDGQVHFALSMPRQQHAVTAKPVNVAEIRYQVLHRQTDLYSPIYEHKFDSAVEYHVSAVTEHARILIGPMKLYPAEDVWPELTRKGYYGELPQFYT